MKNYIQALVAFNTLSSGHSADSLASLSSPTSAPYTEDDSQLIPPLPHISTDLSLLSKPFLWGTPQTPTWHSQQSTMTSLGDDWHNKLLCNAMTGLIENTIIEEVLALYDSDTQAAFDTTSNLKKLSCKTAKSFSLVLKLFKNFVENDGQQLFFGYSNTEATEEYLNFIINRLTTRFERLFLNYKRENNLRLNPAEEKLWLKKQVDGACNIIRLKLRASLYILYNLPELDSYHCQSSQTLYRLSSPLERENWPTISYVAPIIPPNFVGLNKFNTLKVIMPDKEKTAIANCMQHLFSIGNTPEAYMFLADPELTHSFQPTGFSLGTNYTMTYYNQYGMELATQDPNTAPKDMALFVKTMPLTIYDSNSSSDNNVTVPFPVLYFKDKGKKCCLYQNDPAEFVSSLDTVHIYNPISSNPASLFANKRYRGINFLKQATEEGLSNSL